MSTLCLDLFDNYRRYFCYGDVMLPSSDLTNKIIYVHLLLITQMVQYVSPSLMTQCPENPVEKGNPTIIA